MSGFTGAFVFKANCNPGNSWTLTTTFTAVVCGQFFEEMILVFSVGSQSCLIPGSIHGPTFWSTRIPVELCVSTLPKVFWCCCRHSNSLTSLKLAICCVVPNIILPTTCLNYRRLSMINTSCHAPKKGL